VKAAATRGEHKQQLPSCAFSTNFCGSLPLPLEKQQEVGFAAAAHARRIPYTTLSLALFCR